MKYKDWLQEWLDHYIEPTAKIRTYNRYSEIVVQHLIPKLGESEMDEITYNISLQSYCKQEI